MFLIALNEKLRQHRAEGEKGAALVAVMGVMGLGLIITTLLLSSVVNAIGYTSSSRAGVQSQAAADGGVAIAQASLLRGTCEADTTGSGQPSGSFASAALGEIIYDVQVQYRSGEVGEFIDGCPPNSSVNVRVISSGTAIAPGVSVSRGDESVVAADFTQAGPPVESLTPTGPAIFSYSSDGFTGSGSLVSVDGSQADVMIKTGNTVCSGGSDGARDWVIEGGSLTTVGSCTIEGNVWAAGSVVNGSAAGIGGDVIAASYSGTNSGPVTNVWTSGLTSVSNGGAKVLGNIVAGSVSITGGSAVVSGDVWSAAGLTMSGSSRVLGSTESGALNMTSSSRINENALVRGAAYLEGNTSVVGNLKAKSIVLAKKGGNTPVVGSQTVVPAGPPAGPTPPTAPAAPVVPNWVDFTYDVNDWAGYTEIVLSGDCGQIWWPLSHKLKDAIASLTGPGVIDARNCTNGAVLGGSATVELKGDLAIIANKIDLTGGAKIISSNDAKLWLIEPDTNPDTLPTCAGRTFTIDGGFTFGSKVSTMIYTPCLADLGSTHFKGQVFAGRTFLAGDAELGFVAVGLPGYDLSTGSPSGGGGESTSSMFERPTSVRNITRND